MRPLSSTDDLVIAELVQNYLGADVPIRGKGGVGLSAIFGLPPNGEVLFRNVFLFEAGTVPDYQWSSSVGPQRSKLRRVFLLREAICAFEKNDLIRWKSELSAAGPLPPLLPFGLRRRWLINLMVKTAICPASDLPHKWYADDLFTDSDMLSLMRERLFLAFAAQVRVPKSKTVLYEIIDQNFDGIAGKMRRRIYDHING
jgi:hypothetical protein